MFGRLKDKIFSANEMRLKLTFRQCDICGIIGHSTDVFPFQRPICCEPIIACSNTHTRCDVLEVFRIKCIDCPKHSIAKVAEVVYITVTKNKFTN